MEGKSLTAGQVKKELARFKNSQKAKIYQRFFKTGPGQYGEGDVFWGLSVPQKNQAIKGYFDLPLDEIQKLLNDNVHEVRMAGTSILVWQFQKADEKKRKKLVSFYLKNTKKFNNWDLVDVSAAKILGTYLLDKDRPVLYRLVKSKNLWERRIGIMATFHFIRHH